MPYVPDRHDRTRVLNMMCHVCWYVRLCAHADSPGIVALRQQATCTHGDKLMCTSLVWCSDVTFWLPCTVQVAIMVACCDHAQKMATLGWYVDSKEFDFVKHYTVIMMDLQDMI